MNENIKTFVIRSFITPYLKPIGPVSFNFHSYDYKKQNLFFSLNVNGKIGNLLLRICPTYAKKIVKDRQKFFFYKAASMC